MLRNRSQGLDWADWSVLSLCLFFGCGLSFLALEGILQTFLRHKLIEEAALRNARSVRLVELSLLEVSPKQLPPGVIVRPSPEGPEGPEGPVQQTNSFDQQVQGLMATRYGVQRLIQRDRIPYEDSWGGTWIRLQSSHPTHWLYQPDRLSTSCVWFMPLLRSVALLLGILLGTVLFLKSRVEWPFQQLLLHLPNGSPTPLPLLPEKGIAPLRSLSQGVNRLLMRLNAAGEERRQLLRGVAHDLAGPQTRIGLQLDLLQGTYQGPNLKGFRAISSDLCQLASLSEQLVLLAEGDQPNTPKNQLALDELIHQVVSSYPHLTIHLTIPSLLVRLDGDGLQRALRNLIDNALEHGHPPVKIQAWDRQSTLVVEVENKKEGGDRSSRASLPRPKWLQRHRGLGLEIVDRFCRQHQGKLVLNQTEEAFVVQMHLLASSGGTVVI